MSLPRSVAHLLIARHTVVDVPKSNTLLAGVNSLSVAKAQVCFELTILPPVIIAAVA